MRSTYLGIVVCAVLFAIGCGPSRRPGLGDDAPCTSGQIRCDGKTVNTCVDGDYKKGETCPLECADDLGCVTCVPGTGTCSGNESHACADDGSGYIDTTCDALQGMACDPASGSCTGPCAPQNLGTSYIGCEYHPTVTGNTAGTRFDYAVAVANTANEPAAIHVEGGALGTPMLFEVPPNSVKVQALPWVPALKLCNTQDTDGCIGGTMANAALAAKGSYHLRSNQPVTVYQFNALQYTKAGAFSYSNDASLLLPTNVWRASYFVAAYPQLGGVNGSEMAVTATRDNTAVTINSRAASVAEAGAPAFAVGTPQTVMLDAGDVIEITSRTGDFTGSSVTSDKPVQVIGGHYCAAIPDQNTCCCDHIEESMFSTDALGAKYLISAPAVVSIPNGKPQVVRVIATLAGTTLTYDPPQPAAPTTIANAGDFIEIPSTAQTFMISSNNKILVANYMTGQFAGGNTGDPAMTLSVPVDQYRTSYLFHAPTNYESNYVDVTAPMSANIALDGAPLTGFVPIGTTGFGLKRVFPLTPGTNDGNHTISGDQKFGITVYGYGQYTSYWYPGGLNLTDIIQ